MPNKFYSKTGLTWLFLSVFLLAAGPAGARVVKVKLGSSLSPPALHALAPYVALERGLFKKQGLDVEIVEIAGDTNHTKALLAGELDAGFMAIAAKVIKDESPEILSKAYDLAVPRLVFGVNGDISEAAYNYTANFLQKVGFMTDPVPYDKFFERRFVDRVLQELGRM